MQTVLRKLTKDEIEAVASELAKLVQAVNSLRTEAREDATARRKQIKSMEADIAESAKEIRTGLREEDAQMALPRIGKDKAAE